MNTFDNMGKVELRAACKASGIKNYGKMNNEGMRIALRTLQVEAVEEVVEVVAPVAQEEVFTVESALKELADATENTVVTAPKAAGSKGIKIEKNREEQNGVKRPSAGGTCRAIWDYLDMVREATKQLPTVGMVKEEAVVAGWNANNASIEFYQWRKFNGIRGRQ